MGNLMSHLINALRNSLKDSVPLYKTRLETFCVLILGVLNSRTVNLTHLSSAFPGEAETSSNYRRLQRFFQQVRLDYNGIARFIVQFMGISDQKWLLSVDRTNWKFGKKNINILMIAVAYKGVAIPLMWTVLRHRGNSSTRQRVALFKRFCTVFGAEKIAGLTGDREFVGNDWMAWLNTQNIPFILRIKKSFFVTLERRNHSESLKTLLHKLKKGSGRVTYYDCVLGKNPDKNSPCVNLVCKRLKDGTLLVLATNCNPKTALADYKKRWQIETLFAACKTRGFNLEDTHITHPMRIKKIMAVLAIAFCWAHKTGEWQSEKRPIKIKTHKRKAQSMFRYGLDKLRQFLTHQKEKAISLLTCFLKNPAPKQKNKEILI